MKTYHVFRAPEGCGETYLGRTHGLKEARAMAAKHARGELRGLEQSDYESARNGGWEVPPPPVGDAVAWFGKGEWYCACLEAKAEEVEP